jgi:hypothetical protein
MEALRAMREELETALAGDENWRALRPAGAPSGDASPDRRDRDARLVKALEANPLYVAWSNLGQAIDALENADAAPEAGQTASELPEDIRARIRADGHGDAAHRPAEATAGEIRPVGDGVREPKDTATLSRKLAIVPPVEPAAKSEDVAAAKGQPAADLPAYRMTEPAEAKVSFVRRQASSTGAAKGPAEAHAQAADSGNAFVPAAATAEEAEVSIVSAPVRRFLKALSGD